MQQDWTYYIYVAAATMLLALFMRARRRAGNNVWVVCAILAIVGLLILFAVLNG